MGKKASAIAKGAITVAAGVKAIRTAVSDLNRSVHTIGWMDDNGKVVDISEVRHNEIPEHGTLIKPSTDESDYVIDD